MELEVTPEPGDDEREVIVEALRRVVGEPGYVNSAWGSAALREAVGADED
jgi:hypothetical protein